MFVVSSRACFIYIALQFISCRLEVAAIYKAEFRNVSMLERRSRAALYFRS